MREPTTVGPIAFDAKRVRLVQASNFDQKEALGFSTRDRGSSVQVLDQTNLSQHSPFELHKDMSKKQLQIYAAMQVRAAYQ